MSESVIITNEVFSVATLVYARLRRVSGRVIDASYLTENVEYAEHVMAMAKQTRDPELLRLVERLTKVLGLKTDEEPENEIQFTQHEELISVEPTQEDIERAQGANRYIGALR
ncbi:hypothetical protein [Acinetobacter sp. CS-2]|uniref:hypothetical protein n=1 Tax=Acinetobacter sp. CS-2 TaxID=2798861 RepID=UPI001907865C|nr:hypothetical protein [Acinetobacter sp. CS-2]QQN38339.1 hypothetical protein JFY49_09845 [Acinetobacter sp. CS-2]